MNEDEQAIDWNQVRERWALKIPLLNLRGDLALPYASSVAMVISGAHDSVDGLSAIEWLARTRPDEIPLDIAPAKCREVDEAFFEKVVALGLLNLDPNQMEAQLVATDEAVYYVTRGADDLFIRWPWPETSLTMRESQGTFTTVHLATHAKLYEIHLGSLAAMNMLAIYEWAKPTK